ncbi:hypothetical protein [Bdellovibrio reynosensis]|uniref:Uncharacterized protein n=1 Tax=Bdellovibrio reynosensis TaxID=2835041 RepID=A0ABY4C7F6_9BACT|nr:hypothetical protein [Bdellovibrio reynosensis]UOF00922.1 hypothetical protein MNR06_14565 [Bdellovibrio reynosensis]
MKLIIFLFIIFGGVFSGAQTVKKKTAVTPKNSFVFFLLNPELRYERSGSQEIEDRKPQNYSIAYYFQQYSVLLEYASFKEESGNATSSLRRMHTDALLFARYHFFKHSSPQMISTLYAAGGVGAFKEEVTSTLFTERRTDSSDAKFMSALAVGTEFLLPINKSVGLVAGAEGRALMGDGFDPNPIWSLLARIGIEFNF